MYMMFYSYPETAKHLSAHNEFKKEIAQLRKKMEKKQLKNEDINNKLKRYFFNI